MVHVCAIILVSVTFTIARFVCALQVLSCQTLGGELGLQRGLLRL
jgi:hypothetical protein